MTVLRDSSVSIVGLGLHGSWAAAAVARLNPSSLRLWDGDRVMPHNLRSQDYYRGDVGRLKVDVLSNRLRRQTRTRVTAMGRWLLGLNDHDDVVICCADDMDVRFELAYACADAARLFIETRSLGTDGYVHAFVPTREYVTYYRQTCFPPPEQVAEDSCGGAGTIAMGMLVASLVTSIILQWKGGEGKQLPLNEHSIQLGTGHQARPFQMSA